MKKRIFMSIALVLCLCILAGCSATGSVNTDGFVEFLDNENFVPEVGQGDFVDQLANYSYEGQSLSELLNGYFYDGANGGGYKAGYALPNPGRYGGYYGVRFGMENDFRVDENQGVAIYTNQFYTSLALEGLQLPYGIEFTDDLSSVLSKVGISKSADQLTEDVRLWQDGYREIKWQKSAGHPTDDPALDAYSPCDALLFTQEYDIATEDGRPCKVIRTVAFYFYPESQGLSWAEFSVVESYPYP